MVFDVNTIVSRAPLDCGATCLAMLLDYYGETVPVPQLAEECHTGITGCTGRRLVEAGRAHGMDMRAYQIDLDDLYTVDRPAIIHWRYDHFCMFCGVDTDDRVVVINPDSGRFHLTKGSFQMFFSGVAFFNGEPPEHGSEEE